MVQVQGGGTGGRGWVDVPTPLYHHWQCHPGGGGGGELRICREKGGGAVLSNLRGVGMPVDQIRKGSVW